MFSKYLICQFSFFQPMVLDWEFLSDHCLLVPCCEYHAYCPSVFLESTLTFWDKSLLIKMNIQAIQQIFCQYRPSNGKEGDASVIATHVRIFFPLV